MNRTFWSLVLLFLFVGSCAYADDSQAVPKRLTFWKEYLVGNGGTVGSLWTFGSGIEYAFFRDDYNHEVSVSADLFNDRTSYSSQKLLLPVLANYRWYAGNENAKGFYVTGGLGLAIPFGLDHGKGSFAWQAGAGYVVSNRLALELRYLGRQSQTAFNGAGAPVTTNNAFTGGMLHFIF